MTTKDTLGILPSAIVDVVAFSLDGSLKHPFKVLFY